MQIIPDPLFAAWMAAPFIVTMIALWQLLFKPFHAYLEARGAATVGARHDAVAISARTEAKLAELEARLSAAREEAARIRGTHRARAIEAEHEVIERARRAAEAEIDEALERIGAEAQSARDLLHGTAGSLSGEIASRVLGRSVQLGSR